MIIIFLVNLLETNSFIYQKKLHFIQKHIIRIIITKKLKLQSKQANISFKIKLLQKTKE